MHTPADSQAAKETVEKAVAQLRTDNIVTNNPQLREAAQPIVDDAANRGVPNFNIIYLDSEKIYPVSEQKNTDIFSFARQVADQVGGTTVVRTPGNVATASADFPRAAIERADHAMMETPRDYPAGLDAYLHELTNYVVPWTLYSLIAGVVIVALFVGLTFYWLRTRPTT